MISKEERADSLIQRWLDYRIKLDSKSKAIGEEIVKQDLLEAPKRARATAVALEKQSKYLRLSNS